MISEVKTTATVQPGGLIEVRSDNLTEGATVEVIVRIATHDSEPQKAQKTGLSRFIGMTKGKGSFSNVADVDAYIRQERDSWES